MNQSSESLSICQQELNSILPNIQSTLYTALFCKNKLSEPLDSLLFGFFIGFLSSRKEIKIPDYCLPDLLEIYFKCTKQTKTLDILLQLLSSELTSYLYKTTYSPKIDPIQNIFENINKNDKEEILFKKCKTCSMDFNIYDLPNYGLNCGCIVHNKCFDNLVKTNINMNQPLMHCPYCKKEVNYSSIMDSLIFNNPDLLAKYEKLTLEHFTKNSKDSKKCPTKECDYIFFYKQCDTQFTCPKCNKSYCLQCQVEWHKGINCYQYRIFTNNRNEDDYIKFKMTYNLKQCPFCNRWVQNTYGDKTHCKCGNDFCLNCGERYQLNHICNPFRFNIDERRNYIK